MSLTGDFPALARMQERLEELATVPSRAAKASAARIDELMQEQFDHAVDPYEEPWAPLEEVTLARRAKPMPPGLDDSGAMRDTLKVRPLAGAGIGITIDHPASPHQTGWSGRQGSGPARPILPARGELPDGWIEVLEEESARAFKGVVRK